MTKNQSESPTASIAEETASPDHQSTTSTVDHPKAESDERKSKPSGSGPHASIMDLTQEIRFAVVMYGGASLAIYMNGVAQEMLKLVRATAPDPKDPSKPLHADDTLTGSERVYRKLGKMLSRGAEPFLGEAGSIRTRFIIDTLSGTSAGGINAVFLAKALANDQDIGPLRKLWIKEGDIGVLINDKESDKDIKIGVQKPPRSILNSRRMYYELLDALEGMDDPSRQREGPTRTASKHTRTSPYVEELDLFTTATDIWGQVVAMRLADNVAFERRHLNTFHFTYSSSSNHNDFTQENNPFLAFASRCTSAHPAPFEPMKLSDMNSVLRRHKSYKDSPDFRSNDKYWRPYFEEYLQHGGAAKPVSHEERERIRDDRAERFENRPFSDGGVLDNSPFSFVLDKLPFRHTTLPVDRKLLYIEPVPKHPERALDPTHSPNALENALLSVSVLPSYQFIRQDLERVLERNRLIERVNRILLGVQKDEMIRLERSRAKRKAEVAEGRDPKKVNEAERALTTYEFGRKTLAEMIERMGSGWGGYQRLRVAETTDELVKIIANAAGFDDDTDEFLAIQYLVRAWRSERYDPYGKKDPANKAPSESQSEEESKFSESWFLFQYDIRWRLRRLKLVLRKVDELSCLDDRAADVLKIANFAPGTYSDVCSDTPERVREFRSFLQELKRDLSHVLGILEDKRHEFLSRVTDHSLPASESNPLGAAVEAIGIEGGELLTILNKPTEKDREAAAKALLADKRANFDRFLDALNSELKKLMEDVSARVKGEKDYAGKGILSVSDVPQANPDPRDIVRATLRYFYDNFDRYDMISYPILYSTNVGEETDQVEIFRISPEDAEFLIKDKEMRRRKLAGTSIGNFGAFFEEEFRTNDILWGRLDSADRLITALLSSAQQSPELKKVKGELIRDASRAIIAEELSSEKKAGLRALIATSMTQTTTEEESKTFLSKLEDGLKAGPEDLSKLREFLLSSLRGRDPLDDFTDTSKFEHELPPKTIVRSAARASRVFGNMLAGIADEQRINRRYVVWFTRIVQLFWGLVEVAVPGSIPNLIFAHWLKLLYLFEFLLVLGGTLFLNQRIQQFGLLVFLVTVVIHAAVKLLGDMMVKRKDEVVESEPPTEEGRRAVGPPAGRRKKKRSPAWLRAFMTLVIFALVLMALLGLVLLFSVLWADDSSNSPANLIWQKIGDLRNWIARDELNGWNAKTAFRFGIVAVVGLFLLWSVRDDLKGMFGRKK